VEVRERCMLDNTCMKAHLNHQMKWKPYCAFSYTYTSFIKNLIHEIPSKSKWYWNATCNSGHTHFPLMSNLHMWTKCLTTRIQSCLLYTNDHITQISNSVYILIVLFTAMTEKLLKYGTECVALTGLPSTEQWSSHSQTSWLGCYLILCVRIAAHTMQNSSSQSMAYWYVLCDPCTFFVRLCHSV
jgi:hypothetical protein